tara:strand:- start:1050 stop:1340 length:291 start_codon:yes stop_codon:yes gene_type:complete
MGNIMDKRKMKRIMNYKRPTKSRLGIKPSNGRKNKRAAPYVSDKGSSVVSHIGVVLLLFVLLAACVDVGLKTWDEEYQAHQDCIESHRNGTNECGY